VTLPKVPRGRQHHIRKEILDLLTRIVPKGGLKYKDMNLLRHEVDQSVEAIVGMYRLKAVNIAEFWEREGRLNADKKALPSADSQASAEAQDKSGRRVQSWQG
jgi:hypothetical protein